MEIPRIVVPSAQIRSLDIPRINVFAPGNYELFGHYIPVVIDIGKPIVNIPGCVETHELNNTRPEGTKNKKLAQEDDVIIHCDAGIPSYSAMNYEPEQLTIVQEVKPPDVVPPPEPPGAPETPDTGNVTAQDEEVPCPGPNSQRIGDVAASGKEKVSGFELQSDPINPGKQICVVLYEDINVVEQYLPSAQVVTTTATIATVAGASALLAKPLADLILRVFRPAIKKALTKGNAVLGRNPYRPTQEELRTNEYRKKKGLDPRNFAKEHKEREKKLKERKA
tara:strand:+ start:582 stop:1421 length:840 start_codon:yes stop_codon:yes gene_type:complete